MSANRVVLFVFYALMILLAIAWFLTGDDWNQILFYLLFILGFGFIAYCGYLDVKVKARPRLK